MWVWSSANSEAAAGCRPLGYIPSGLAFGGQRARDTPRHDSNMNEAFCKPLRGYQTVQVCTPVGVVLLARFGEG